jgi:uncharacterized protein (DUF885 family)
LVADTDASRTSAELNAVADALLAHIRDTNPGAQAAAAIPVKKFADLSLQSAKDERAFAVAQLARLSTVPVADLREGQRILAGTLRHYFESRTHADKDYWYDFVVTPYNGSGLLSSARTALGAQKLGTTAERDEYLRLLGEYAGLIDQMSQKTRAQADHGIRLPRPAIEGVKTSFVQLRASSPNMLAVAPKRLEGVDVAAQASFQAEVAARIDSQILPALDRLIGVFDDKYVAEAPTRAGLSQYPGGLEAYKRDIFRHTGLNLTPQQIHQRGLAAMKQIEARMAEIRAEVGFKGDRQTFEAQMRKDLRYIAKNEEDLEQRYHSIIARIEPRVPEFFSRLPQASYGIKRLDPAGESGMSFGIYRIPSPPENRGYYMYNASGLDKRSLVMAPHLMYHELIPGHHFQVSLAAEDKSLHPVRPLIFNAAFQEGWGEYAAELAKEMGGYPDPYEEYGHLLTQSLMATRLVVDTGMNALGWPLDRARQYMRDHGTESDSLAATETLRYSTDMYGQALGYRLGYEQFMNDRRRAEAELGDRFDIRAFHAAAVGNGTMPLNVLAAHMQWFIDQQKKARGPG